MLASARHAALGAAAAAVSMCGCWAWRMCRVVCRMCLCVLEDSPEPENVTGVWGLACMFPGVPAALLFCLSAVGFDRFCELLCCGDTSTWVLDPAGGGCVCPVSAHVPKMTTAHSYLRGVSVLCVGAFALGCLQPYGGLHKVHMRVAAAPRCAARSSVCVCAVLSAPCCRVKPLMARLHVLAELLGIVGRLATTAPLYGERPSVCITPRNPQQEEGF